MFELGFGDFPQLQRHPSCESLDAGIVLHRLDWNDFVASFGFRDPRSANGGNVRAVANFAWNLVRHDLRQSAHQNQSDRQNSRDFEEAIPHEKAEIHVATRPSHHGVLLDFF